MVHCLRRFSAATLQTFHPGGVSVLRANGFSIRGLSTQLLNFRTHLANDGFHRGVQVCGVLSPVLCLSGFLENSLFLDVSRNLFL